MSTSTIRDGLIGKDFPRPPSPPPPAVSPPSSTCRCESLRIIRLVISPFESHSFPRLGSHFLCSLMKSLVTYRIRLPLLILSLIFLQLQKLSEIVFLYLTFVTVSSKWLNIICVYLFLTHFFSIF